MSNYTANVPLINEPFVGPDGRVSEAWFMFLLQLFRRTGGASGSALDDLATDIATISDDPAISLLSHALANTNLLLQTATADSSDQAPKATLAAQIITLALMLEEAQDALSKMRRALQDAITDQLMPIDPIRSMAYQDSSHVAIKGGSIDGTPIGSTSVALGSFTTLTLTNAAPTVASGQIGFGATTALSVGAAGGASDLPATPVGYLVFNLGGTNFKLPYYNS